MSRTRSTSCLRQVRHVLLITLVLYLSNVEQVSGFYVPGVAPVEFRKGDSLVVKVRQDHGFVESLSLKHFFVFRQAVKMTSSITQLPYSYYSLPFCKPNASKLVYK